MRKIKVFIVIDHLGAGGAQRQVVEFLKEVNRDKFDVTVVNLDKDYDNLSDVIKAFGIKVIGIRHKGFINPGTLFALIELFRINKPDVVYTYLFTSDCYGRLAAKLAGVAVIICAIRADDIWKKWHHILADRILAKSTDIITINANGLKNYLIKVEKINPDKIRVIYNGIDIKRFDCRKLVIDHRSELGIQSDELVVGMVGRLSEQKDYKIFIEAVSRLSLDPDCRGLASGIKVLIIGDGPLLESLKLQVVGYKLQDKVKFLGHRSDTDALLSVFDIGVLSSHYEGCPNVILEYMACSKPVVASDVGGCRELVVEGKTGFIVPAADPQAMADKILALIKDKELRLKMGAEGRRRIEENFTSDVMARNTEELFLELLKKKSVI